MSKLSEFLHNAAAFFSNTQSTTPQVNDAVSALTTAASAVETALPAVAKTGVDAALASAGPLGVALTPFANDLIDALIAELTSRKTPVPVLGGVVKAPLAPAGQGS